ncbi:hypothetical protein GGI05_007721, partial [Coemansia sp. RSA 2603]
CTYAEFRRKPWSRMATAPPKMIASAANQKQHISFLMARERKLLHAVWAYSASAATQRQGGA